MINCGLLSLKFLLTETIILRNSDFYFIKENTGTKFRNKNVNFFFNFRRIVNDSPLTYRTDYALGPFPWDRSDAPLTHLHSKARQTAARGAWWPCHRGPCPCHRETQCPAQAPPWLPQELAPRQKYPSLCPILL